MTPHKDSRGAGSLKLDRIFPGIGRLWRASGLSDTPDGRARFKRMNRMLTDLYQAGQWEYLRRLIGKELTPLHLWDAYQNHTLDRLPDAGTVVPLWEAMTQWVDTNPTGKHNRNSRRDAVRILSALQPKATVGELPEILKRYQVKAADTPSMFNHVRVHCLKFLQSAVGKRHRLYEDVWHIDAMKEALKRKRGLTRAEAVAVWAFLPEPYNHAFRAMCLTGMRPGEFLANYWEVRPDRIEVHGTKTEGSDRVIPLVEVIQPAHPKVTLPMMRAHLNKWAADKLEPYTARRTFANAMEEAGIPRARRRMYLGHGIKDVSDLYERSHLTAYLVEDAEQLREFWGLGGLKLLEEKA